MEVNDLMDEILYQSIPALDRAMMLEQEMKAEKEKICFSRRFERRMRRLIRKYCAGERAKCRERIPGHAQCSLHLERRFVLILLCILLLMTATVALASNIDKLVQRFHWYDDRQGADFYNYKSNKKWKTDEIVWIYPAYIPSEYELTEEKKDEKFFRLNLEYRNEAGDELCYTMWILGNITMAFDAEYDSLEEIERNGMVWTVTYREDRYWMARAQKGDLFFLVRTPDMLQKDELIQILEGIKPPERNTVVIEQEVGDEQELEEKVYK